MEFLKDKIKDILYSTTFNANKKHLAYLKKSFIDHNIPLGELQDVWDGRISLDLVEEDVLFFLAKNIYELTKDEELGPSLYYTSSQIEHAEQHKRVRCDDAMEYPLIFDHVIRVKNDQYMTMITAQEIKRMHDQQIIVYNFDTQRNPKYKEDHEGQIIKIPNVNRNAVNEIAAKFLENKFITNTITLNILKNGMEEYAFKNGKLIVHRGEINIIDGYHRNMGLMKALNQNPYLDYPMEIRITNWDVTQCQAFIYQESLRNKISPAYLKSVNVSKWGNKVVSQINQSQSDLGGKIVVDYGLILHGKGYALASIMSDTIDYLWKIETNAEVTILSKYLQDFFDLLIYLNKSHFIHDIKQSRQESVITYPAMFSGYLALAHQWQEQNWEEKLSHFIQQMDDHIDCQIWQDIGIINKAKKPVTSLTKPKMKKIADYFRRWNSVQQGA